MMYNPLREFKWYRKLRGGKWYYNFYMYDELGYDVVFFWERNSVITTTYRSTIKEENYD